jgi:transcriptional regulator with XRE-family HTH domain
VTHGRRGGPGTDAVIIPLAGVDKTQTALGRRLRLVREARGFTTERLAAACGMAPSRLGMVEQGRVRLTSAEMFALTTALRIPLHLLHAEGGDLSRLRRI